MINTEYTDIQLNSSRKHCGLIWRIQVINHLPSMQIQPVYTWNLMTDSHFDVHIPCRHSKESSQNLPEQNHEVQQGEVLL